MQRRSSFSFQECELYPLEAKFRRHTHSASLCFIVKECQRECRPRNSVVVPCDVLLTKKDLWGPSYLVVYWCGVGIIGKTSSQLGIRTTTRKVSKNFGTRFAELVTSYTKKHGERQSMFRILAVWHWIIKHLDLKFHNIQSNISMKKKQTENIIWMLNQSNTYIHFNTCILMHLLQSITAGLIAM